MPFDSEVGSALVSSGVALPLLSQIGADGGPPGRWCSNEPPRRRRHPLCGVCALVATAPAAAQAAYRLPPVQHLFVIMLENEDYSSTFGDPAAFPYLAGTPVKQGALLSDYYATGHESNDNYVSIVLGLPPNVQNQADCQRLERSTTLTASKRRRPRPPAASAHKS